MHICICVFVFFLDLSRGSLRGQMAVLSPSPPLLFLLPSSVSRSLICSWGSVRVSGGFYFVILLLFLHLLLSSSNYVSCLLIFVVFFDLSGGACADKWRRRRRRLELDLSSNMARGPRLELDLSSNLARAPQVRTRFEF